MPIIAVSTCNTRVPAIESRVLAPGSLCICRFYCTFVLQQPIQWSSAGGLQCSRHAVQGYVLVTCLMQQQERRLGRRGAEQLGSVCASHLPYVLHDAHHHALDTLCIDWYSREIQSSPQCIHVRRDKATAQSLAAYAVHCSARPRTARRASAASAMRQSFKASLTTLAQIHTPRS